MGYACPVCADPQADAGHLANHLAFTAILGEEAHEAWLDEHAPGWGEMDEAGLAEAVVDDVEETTFPQVFDDTVGGLEDSPAEPLEERSGALFDDDGPTEAHDHGHDHGHEPHRGAAGGAPAADAPVDAETAAILEEAREMTRRLLGEDEGAGVDEDAVDACEGEDGGAAPGEEGEADAAGPGDGSRSSDENE